jgi:hypothetical protein
MPLAELQRRPKKIRHSVWVLLPLVALQCMALVALGLLEQALHLRLYMVGLRAAGLLWVNLALEHWALLGQPELLARLAQQEQVWQRERRELDYSALVYRQVWQA